MTFERNFYMTLQGARRFTAAVIVLACACLASSAIAGPSEIPLSKLSVATYGAGLVGVGDYPPKSLTSTTGATISVANETAVGNGYASASLDPFPKAEAYSYGSISGAMFDSYVISQTSSIYYFKLSGSSPISVPLIIEGNLETGVKTRDCRGFFCAASATSSLNIEGINVAKKEIGCYNVSFCSANDNSAYKIHQSFGTGAAYKVVLSAWSDIMGNATAHAYADPFISIDPDFVLSHPDVSLAFSTGVVNAPASSAPEPSSWVFLIAGFGLVGGASRRARALISNRRG